MGTPSAMDPWGWASSSYLQCGLPMAKVNALMDRALALNPGDSVTHWISGWNSVFTPNPLKALDAFEHMLRLDPRSPWRFTTLAGQGLALFQLDRFEEAASLVTEALEHIPAVRPVFSRLLAAADALYLDPNSEALFDLVRDGSLKPKVVEGLRLASLDRAHPKA